MYLNAYLTPCPGYGWEGGPEFSTRIVSMANGRERRNANWSQARRKYSAPFLNIRKEAYREILRMFLVCEGMAHCFRFRDELDNTAVDEQFGVGDGTTTDFQLGVVWVADTVPYYRNVYALPEQPTINANGAPASGLAVDLDRGTVTFDTAPAPGTLLTWSGLFDVWVRFNDDYLPFSLDNPDATNGSVNLIEVPPPEVTVS